ncbi:CRAL/TRIO domain-containing protein [Wallemia mellicola]|nr:CRAL/TRIO domain-containing protein [Wallemia mellicola]
MSIQAAEYAEYEGLVLDMQTRLLDCAITEIIQEISDVDDIVRRSTEYLRDKATIFRFLKKSHYKEEETYERIKNHLIIRLQSNLDQLDQPALLEVDDGSECPVGYFLKDIRESRGRLVLVVSLSKVLPRHVDIDNGDDDDDNDTFDEIKESILYLWEMGRKMMHHHAIQDGSYDNYLDFLTVIDASGASMSNIHYELVKFFVDIISTHFPNTSKQIIVLNSKVWTNTLWTVAKPLLPKKIVERISFPNKTKLSNSTDLGGKKDYDSVSDYGITKMKSQLPSHNSSRTTLWYTPNASPRQTPSITPASSQTNILAIVNKIPNFPLKIRKGTKNNDTRKSVRVYDILGYKERIATWHKDRLADNIVDRDADNGLKTPISASSGVATPVTVLDRYSYLNPRYGQNRRAILENLFKEGVVVAQKDFEIKHDEINVPNLEVIKLMQSLTSKGYVKTQFSWQWYYYTLTPEGLDYLREYLHLPSEIVPNTHRKAQRPSRPAQVRQQGEGFRSGRDDRDSYRRADAKEGADAGYRPRFGGVGRGAPRA